MKRRNWNSAPGLLAITLGVLAAVSGAPAQAATQAPYALSETYQDWQVRCQTVTIEENATRNCEMVQERLEAQNGARVLLVAIQSRGDSASMTMIAPFGLLLSEGVRIQTENGSPLMAAPFQTCLQVGCVVVADLNQTVIDAFAIGSEAIVAMTARNGSTVQTTLSLAGFSAAWDGLGEL